MFPFAIPLFFILLGVPPLLFTTFLPYGFDVGVHTIFLQLYRFLLFFIGNWYDKTLHLHWWSLLSGLLIFTRKLFI